jgi:hypothetical protein
VALTYQMHRPFSLHTRRQRLERRLIANINIAACQRADLAARLKRRDKSRANAAARAENKGAKSGLENSIKFASCQTYRATQASSKGFWQSGAGL